MEPNEIRGNDNLYWVWLSLCLGEANKSFVPLLETLGTPYDIYRADEAEYRGAGIKSAWLLDALGNKNLDGAYGICESCIRTGTDIVKYGGEYYPSRLKSISNPPVLLYSKGKRQKLDGKLCISVVGTRRMTSYGRAAAYKMAYELSAAGVVVVSGMALGIDSVAACGAIEAGGNTVAVLGCGIDIVYPPEHEKLMEIIASNGTVITEYAPGSPPTGSHFPIRNRLISGLSQGTLIVEADSRSGALITAKEAIVQGRDLYALPGMISEKNAEGTNNLLRDGANLVLSAEDILENYELLYGDKLNMKALFTAKKRSGYSDGALSRYGVYGRVYGRVPASFEEYEKDRSSGTKDGVKLEKSTPNTGGEKPVTERAEAVKNDRSDEILGKLDEATREIFNAIPLDTPISVDKLVVQGYNMGMLMSALTVLEISGLVKSLPGGLFMRA